MSALMPERDPTDIAGLEAAEDEAKRKRDVQRAQEVEDFRQLMQTARGRRFVWRLLGITGVFRSSYRSGNGGLDMAFLEGNRNVGLVLMAEIHSTCPELYAVMAKENESR